MPRPKPPIIIYTGDVERRIIRAAVVTMKFYAANNLRFSELPAYDKVLKCLDERTRRVKSERKSEKSAAAAAAGGKVA